MDKQKILNSIIEKLNLEAAALKKAAYIAHKDATNSESKAENKYDTRGLEASYLAEAQAKLAAEVFHNVEVYKSLVLKAFNEDSVITVTALVELEDENKSRSFYFIGPTWGGIIIESDSNNIMLISTTSPLGAAIIGKEIGDVVIINSKKQYEIIAIS
jgi:transcription elongation GreA/GreB family factor